MHVFSIKKIDWDVPRFWGFCEMSVHLQDFYQKSSTVCRKQMQQ